MKPRRRPRRRLSDAVVARTLQTLRLEAIAKGDMEPISFREFYFQWHLQRHGRARISDFIVPWPVLQIETIEMWMDEQDGDLDDDTDDTTAPTAACHVDVGPAPDLSGTVGEPLGGSRVSAV